MIKEQLEKLGLDEKEIKAYLAALELGESHILPITQKACLPRTTTFHALERLRDHGLVHIVLRGMRHIYTPVQPRKILTLLRQQKEKMVERIDAFESALPELARLYSVSPFEPKIRFYRGEEIKEIYEEILKASVDQIYYTGDIDRLDEILGKQYLQGWIKRRIEKGIWTYSIRSKKTESEAEIYKPTKEHLRTARYASGQYKSPSHVYIFGDNVAILTSSKENFGILITSRDFATTMKSWFLELWRTLK